MQMAQLTGFHRPVRRAVLLRAGALLMLASLALSARSQAHQVQQGDLILRSSLVGSQRLSRATASQYEIKPAPNRAALIVVVSGPGGAAEVTYAAKVTASVQNPAGIKQDIKMREVRDGARVTYLGAYDFLPNEVLDFNISALPSGDPHAAALTLSYQDRMWAY